MQASGVGKGRILKKRLDFLPTVEECIGPCDQLIKL